MYSTTLCRERLDRSLHILNRCHGFLTVRDCARTYGIWQWEVRQASQLGWLEIETKRPSTGRPSRIVRKVSNPHTAKLPPCRSQIEKGISFRHWLFARTSVQSAIKGGDRRFFGMPPLTVAYQRTFQRPGAAQEPPRVNVSPLATSSCQSRPPMALRKRQWELPLAQMMLTTAGEIWQQLRDTGSRRARYAPIAF